MQCPDCKGYRHDGPCPDLHADYMAAFEALMLYQDRHPPAHRTPKQVEEVSRLTSICGHMKYKYETAEMRTWQK